MSSKGTKIKVGIDKNIASSSSNSDNFFVVVNRLASSHLHHNQSQLFPSSITSLVSDLLTLCPMGLEEASTVPPLPCQICVVPPLDDAARSARKARVRRLLPSSRQPRPRVGKRRHKGLELQPLPNKQSICLMQFYFTLFHS